MPKKTPQDKQKRADLLARMPPSATRVLVVTAKGERKYVPIEELADTDVIQTKKSGDPIVMKNEPGRKTPVDVGPANATVAELLKRKSAAMAVDPVMTRVKSAPESPDVLHEVILGLCEEASSLKFEREEAAREGKDSSQLSSRRVQALRAVGDTWLKRMDQITARTIDMDSPAFAVLFKFIMDTFREAMNSAKMRPEQVETVFAKLSAMVTDDWKSEAKNRMKGSV